MFIKKKLYKCYPQAPAALVHSSYTVQSDFNPTSLNDISTFRRGGGDIMPFYDTLEVQQL